MPLTRSKVQSIQATVLDWYSSNKRDLPWRKTQDPYHILVSEIMLQQTQVSRVIPKYEEFLRLFPTVDALAIAPSADVIRAWKGLGYNRRALNLQRAARVIIDKYDGEVPSDLNALRALPGIGRYTAGAVRNFAFGLDTPAVDTNVKQFIDHFVLYKPKISPNPSLRKRGTPPFQKGRLGGISSTRSENEYYDLAEQLTPKGKAREWLHAVMDYSSLVLKRQKTTGSTLRVQPVKSEPFVGSNRYLRGRIIDLLRDRAATSTTLFTKIAKPIDVDRTRFNQLIEALEQEGFLVLKARMLQLA